MDMGKKNKSKSNIVAALWQNALLDAKIITLAKKFRKKFGIPTSGFLSHEEFDEFRSEMAIKYGNDQARIDNFNSFEVEAKKIFPYRGIIADMDFRQMLIMYYFFDKIDDKYLEEKKYSNTDVKIIWDRMSGVGLKEPVEDGIYIKIGPYTPIDHIKEFVGEKSEMIKKAQELFRAKEKLPPPKKIKLHGHIRRDNMIHALNDFSSKELREFGVQGTYKEQLIGYLMEKLGFSGVINGGVVKSVLQRRRKMMRALSKN